MKIQKISARPMNHDEFNRHLLSFPPMDNIILGNINEAYKKEWIDTFEIISRNPKYLEYEYVYDLIMKLISSSKSENVVKIVENLLYYGIKDKYHAALISIALSNPLISSKVLLHNNTPPSIIDPIVVHLNLNLVFKTSLSNNAYLQAIIKDLQSGSVWMNERFGVLMLSRVIQSATDQFITETSKYDLSPDIVQMYQNVANTSRITSINKELVRNINSNKNPGFQIYKWITGVSITPEDFCTSLLGIISNPAYDLYKDKIYSLVYKKFQSSSQHFLAAFQMSLEENAVITTLVNKNHDFLGKTIDLLKEHPSIINKIKNLSSFNTIINRALKDPNFRELTLSLPQDCFAMLPLLPDNYEIVRKHFYPEETTDKEIEELLAQENNWYKHSQSAKVIKQAKWQDVTVGLLASLVAVLGGSTISSAVQRSGIPKETIEKALNDKEKMDQAQQIYNEVKDTNIDFSDIIERIKKIQPLYTDNQLIDDITRTLWGEGRGEGNRGIDAIATVIYNRAGGNPQNMESVIKAKRQFSVWNAGKPLISVKNVNDQLIWNYCKKIATDLVERKFIPMGKWTHYYNPKKANPSWGKYPSTTIGNHRFLTL